MKTLKRIIILTFALLVLNIPAQAAEKPPVKPCDTKCYQQQRLDEMIRIKHQANCIKKP